ncbi:MICAL-like protein 1 isoform X1 [Xyrauchen texanus]|uniref:MICAL-like protein 1 isoform X1 n=1 Tax=Xyrauchen texanus TaxID=154827 RepID=UPI00224214F1|nr:MICAL-like protein 1 isoform X1 [Xyrauchen texanus]
MASLKALQDWCRIQCESYTDVDIKNMSSSFRDGLAFCAIIHRHRPDLIDFDSLSKENVFENNRLAFEVAESELGIPALLDPEDMVSMSVPDRLSIITYVSQYYNFFTNKSHANPIRMKKPVGPGTIVAAVKRPSSEGLCATQTELGADSQSKRCTLSSTCSVCGKHVHLVQRCIVDSRLYHRNCFRCRECSSTLLPGSYKFTEDADSLVCTHHFTKSASTNQNGSPEMRRQLVHKISKSPKNLHNSSHDSKALLSDGQFTPEGEEVTYRETQPGSILMDKTQPCSSSPPNPFYEPEDEDQHTKQEDDHKPEADVDNFDIPSTPVKSTAAEIRQVPAPRQVFKPTPVPRSRPPRTSESPTANGDPDTHSRFVPVPRERMHSPAGSSKVSDTLKPKDPPWLVLVQPEPKKKAPPPPPSGIATPPYSASTPLLKEQKSRPATPPNPFDDDNEEEEEEGPEMGSKDSPGPVVACHPWYGITEAAEVTGADTSRKSPGPESPVSVQKKKRPAPRAPKSSPSALPSSQSSSPAPSLALSTESLSSSDNSAVFQQLTANEQEHLFTKSVSEPSINIADTASSPKTELQPRHSPNLSPPPLPTNTSSAPATPQTNRCMRSVPPRPSAGRNPSPSLQTPSIPGKRTCKENPFNRKTGPSVSSPVSRPPKGPRPARPPAPGHGFPLIKRKVQSDQYIPVEDIHIEMSDLEKRLNELEQRGVDLEKSLRDCSDDDKEEHLLVDWFSLIHEKHMLVRKEAELVYTAKQQNLEERQADVEYELRCLLNKPEKEWTADDKDRENQLMAELVTIIERRNQIVNSIDQDRQREEEEDKLVAAMLKKKDFHADREQKKKAAKFKPIKVLKRLSTKSVVKDDGGKKENS